MRVKQKIFTSVIAISCMGLLYAASAGNKHIPFRYLLPEIPEPVAQPAAQPVDSPKLKYPMKEREGDFVSDKSNDPFYLKDPPAIEQNVEYDTKTGMYVVTEKVAGHDVRPPMYMTYEEYLAYTEKQERAAYIKDRQHAISLVEDKSIVPPIQVKKQFFDKLFGGSKIEIKPQGNVEMTLGGNVQKTNNPNIPIRNRKTGGFDFDMNININVIGKIGDKLQLGVKYNTQSGFDFDNQVKLGYTGDEDDIIKVIELGNVSLPLQTRLITGSQTLFGAKVQLQFGRLMWTSVISQQKSKKETVLIENGAQKQNFEIRSDQYEENKHFFLAQYFRNQFDYALSGLPNIKSVVNVTRIEVWVTNRNGTTQNVRDIVGLNDLGESAPYSNQIANTSNGDSRPRNEANNLYGNLIANPNYRFVNNIVAELQGTDFNLQQGQDFEKTYARKLNDNEFTFNRQLGYLSLNSQLNPNEVLAVAFQYEYNGAVFQVGEFGNQVPPDSNSTSKVLYLKLLKGTTVRPALPIWNLMMKNIYSLGAFNLSNEDFRLDVYYNDPGGGLKRYMPKGCISGKPLLSVLNLDNLNMNNDPQPDGIFDYVPGVTIVTQNGRLIFPVKEPFGDNLRNAFNACSTPSSITDAYVYDQLYDSTKFRAQQFPEFNRFVIKGQYKGSNNREISLGAGNIPRGSVVVTAGGQKLIENTQYTVDYNLGRITILDQGILNSGQQVKVDYENNNLFAAQVRSMYGTRLDYRISSKFNIGATVMHLKERPFTQKVNIGDDPISNTIMGLDIKYETNAPWLTKALDKLPIYSTKEMSTISTYAEMAYLKPGHSKAINGADKEGQVYVDDFEGTSSGYDLKTPPVSWKMASTPRKSVNSAGHVLFPEADLINDDRYGYNRAKIAWYRIDNSFFNQQTCPDIVWNNPDPLTNLKSHYVRLIPTQEVFPNRPNQTLDQNLYTFDLTYSPKDRGPYNYEFSPGVTPGISAGVDPTTGALKSPATRWGGIMRSIDNNDLEATNVEFIEFWLLDPFIYNTTSAGGKLYFNLGNISEDILRDSRMSYENGIYADTGLLDRTPWGWVPKQPSLVDAFDNDQNLRPQQDVGFDGMDDVAERARKREDFLNKINDPLNNYVQSVRDKLEGDPASDNYKYFKDEDVYGGTASVIARYKNYTGLEGNSPVQTNSISSTAQTNLPDKEDLNKDNTLNENEEYFQYEVDMKPGMGVGTNPYIVSVVDQTNNPNIGVDGNGVTSRWIQFRIPIHEYTSRTGNIPDFKSIQFMRMFLTNWNEDVTLRFGTLELRRNQWRTYNLNLDEACDGPGSDAPNGFFNVASVGIEEHSGKTPVNYVLPPNIQRTQALGAQTNQFVAQNEQSLAINACDLKDCGRKAVFKNLTLDVRRYKTLKMYIHANSIEGQVPVHDKEVTAFVRVGSDFKDNYYEYEVPLMVTPAGKYSNEEGSPDHEIVWPDLNSIDISLQDFVHLKEKRNTLAGYPRTEPYTETDSKGRLITIVGNPDIGSIKTIMLGLHNPHKGEPNNPLTDADDGQPKCVEVWFDELRVSGFEESGGVAALATVSVKLADLGNVSLSGEMHTKGFGQVEQKIDQRYKDNMYKYDFSTNLEAGKLLPVKSGIRIPFYANYAQQFSTPEFDPYQFDIPTKEYLKTLKEAVGGDSMRHYRSQIQTINTRRGYNFSNVRIVPQTKAKRPHVYDPGNFNFTYSYNEVLLSDPYIEKNSKKNWMGIIGWSFAPQTKDLAPFKKIIKSKSKWLDLFRDFSWNPMPSTMAVTTDMNRDLTEIKLRSLGEVGFDIPASYSKNFRWNRSYVFKYNPFKSLSIDYTANDNARIDEPIGLINTKEKKHEVWSNIGDGGRNTNYTQQLGVNYTVPINKLPCFDWITATAGYNGTYSWTALPWQRDSATGNLIQNSLGNIISNSQNDRAKVDFNFKKLYDKVPFLKTYNSPNPNAGDKKENDKKREAVRKAREKIKDEMTKLKEKRVKLKEELKKAKDIARNDTTYHNKKIANQDRIRASLAANAASISAKNKEISAADKKAKPGLKDELTRLKEAREKLKDDLKKAKGDADVVRLKTELKANRKSLKQKRSDFENKQAPSNPLISIVLRPLLSLKKVSVEYKETKSTIVPGFTGYSQILGNQIDGKNKYVTDKSLRSAPGYDFVFGSQMGDRFFKGVDKFSRDGWLDEAASKGWITKDTLLNQKFVQTRSQRLDVTATVEPWPDLKIDFTLFRDYTENHSQFFKYVADENGVFGFAHLNPSDMGSYSISYLPAKTMFEKVDSKGYSNTYAQFEKNREIISQRLGAQNPNINPDSAYRNPSTGEVSPNFKPGYGPKSQDVLIPSFLAAYNKQDANKVQLNPFKASPMPNWRISYNGLTKFKWAQSIFTNFTITHGYNSTLTVSSFQTNLSYRGDGTPFGQSGKDTLNANFFPLYNMPSIVLNEQLSPLLGIDMTFKNNVTAKVDYKQSRTQTMNFSDFQLIELQSKQLTIGAGYKIKGLKLPIKIKGKKIRLDNDLNFKFDFSYRDNVTINHRIDEGVPQITSGSRVINIAPSIDYIVSKRLNVRVFFEETMTTPKISSGFPTTNTKGGITLRFSLAD